MRQLPAKELGWWWLLFLFLQYATSATSYAWTFASKGRANGNVIHITYFLTPNNEKVPVHAVVYTGHLINGICEYANQYDMGVDSIQTGDRVVMDGLTLLEVVGGNAACMVTFYTYHQFVTDTLRLVSTNANYVATIPATSEVMIQ